MSPDLVRPPLERRRWIFPMLVTLITLAWLLTLLALLWNLFAVGMEAWADHHGNHGARSAELGAKGDRLSIWLALVGVCGPVLVAAVAFAGRLTRTGIAYLVLAGLLTIPAAAMVADAYSRLHQPDPPPAGPVGCQEHSGGDTTCPGG